jgi:hypothetical protein
VVELLKPGRGGFLRPFGCGRFIKELLLGNGPYGSPHIDPATGAPQADIFYHYMTSFLGAIAQARATREDQWEARHVRRCFHFTENLGHSTLEMTRHYTELADSDVEVKQKACSPAEMLRLRG